MTKREIEARRALRMVAHSYLEYLEKFEKPEDNVCVSTFEQWLAYEMPIEEEKEEWQDSHAVYGYPPEFEIKGERNSTTWGNTSEEYKKAWLEQSEEASKNSRLGMAGDDNPYEKLKIKGREEKEEKNLKNERIFLSTEDLIAEEMLKLINKWLATMPKYQDTYYYPNINYYGKFGFCSANWKGSQTDCHRLAHNLVFKTKEEAMQKSEEILKLINK